MTGANSPTSLHSSSFNFHALHNMNAHRVAIRLESILPASAVRGNLPLDVGRLEKDLPNFRIQFILNTGRIGLPAAELRFLLPARAGGSPTELRMAFEPGVHAPAAPSINRYNLHQFLADFQGRPGGAGSMNRFDHPDLREEKIISKKKRTLKMKIVAHGFVPYPDVFAMDTVLRDNRTPPTVRDFIRMLRDATAVSMIWYCMFDSDLVARLPTETIEPLQRMIFQRQPPLFQYEPSRTTLTLEMAQYAEFGEKMYCTADRNIPGGFSGPRHQLPDMQGRPTIETVARTHIIGHVREFHGQERLAEDLCGGLQDMRLVKSKYPVLTGGPGAVPQLDNAVAVPNDSHVYIGYIGKASSVTQDYNAPPAGTIFQIQWQQKMIDKVYSVVLDVSPSTLQDRDAAFVVALFKVPSKVKERAAISVGSSRTEKVRLVSVPNRETAQTQLEALHRYANMNVEPTIISLQILSVYRRNIVRIPTRDIRGDAAIWNRALGETHAYQLQNHALPLGANNVLTRLVHDLDRHIELLETPLQGSRIDACLALTWLLLATGSTVIFVSDSAESRADLSARMWDMRGRARNAPEFGQVWVKKRLLTYTCSPMSYDHGSPAGIETIRGIDLSTRFLDDLRSHEWLFSESSGLGQPPSTIQHGGVPQEMCMGSAIQCLLSSDKVTNEARRQYYLERQQEIDSTRSIFAKVDAILETRNNFERQILCSAHLLITNSATAVAKNVRDSMQNAVLIYMNTQSTPFSTVAATIASYPNAREVFVCGNSSDDRYPLRWYARTHNEARRATVHGAWKVFIRAGNVPHSLA